ncbi:MAG: hemerythrin family protein [Clostridia bacterium]|nr:hemerythrin family protein [Clostridia bacterium]
MIIWDEKFSVGVEKIDDQHQTFFELINKLESLTHETNFEERLPILLNEIVEYAALHFKTEEKMMEAVQYPDLEQHKIFHQRIKDDIYMECKRIVEREVHAMDIIWLYNYMLDWIKTHIIEEDLKYKPYFQK